MKKFWIFAIIIFCFTANASSEGFRVGASLGYYSVADSIYKNSYGSGNLMYGGFLSYDLSNNIELRGEISYFSDKGEMTLTKEKIKFSLIPVMIGIRTRLIQIKNLNPYLGAGIDFSFFNFEVRNCYLERPLYSSL